MAKLSARGRTMIRHLVKAMPDRPENGISNQTRHYAMMSDGKVLFKSSYTLSMQYVKGGDIHVSRHSGTWTVAKIAKESFDNLLTKGYKDIAV